MANNFNIDVTAPFTDKERANLEKVFWGFFPLKGGHNGKEPKEPKTPSNIRGLHIISYGDSNKTGNKFSDIPLKGQKKLTTDEEIRDFLSLNMIDYENASYCGFQRAGVVTIDFDNDGEKAESYEKIKEIINNGKLSNIPIRQTDKGFHLDFLMLNIPKEIQMKQTECLLACGLRADVRPSFTGNGRYIVLRLNGKYRKYIQTVDEIPTLPPIFYPVKTISKNTEYINLIGLQEGNRNALLFAHNGLLQAKGINREQRLEITNFINENIISSPLEQSEILSICRDTASNYSPSIDILKDNREIQIENLEEEEERLLRKTLCDKGAELYRKLGDWFCEKFNVIRIGSNPYFYNNGIYSPLEEIEIKSYLNRIKPFTKNQISEITEKIKLTQNIYIVEKDNKKLIPFKNGYINLNEANTVEEVKLLKVHPYTPKDKFFFRLPFNWNPTIEEEANGKYKDFVNKFISDIACGQQEYITKLFEIGAISLWRSNNEGIYKKAFFLTGKGANGKSTFIDFLVYCIGESNTSKLSPVELSDKFRQGNLLNKLLNYDSELSNLKFKAKDLKSAITGDTLTHEAKFKDSFDFKPHCAFIFACNSVPNNDDFSSAMERRLCIIEFNADFSKNSKNRDVNFSDKIQNPKMAEYYLFKIVETLKKILLNGGNMEDSPLCDNSVTEYISSSAHVIGFLRQWKEDQEEDYIKDSSYLKGYPLQDLCLDDLYNEYKEFCQKDNRGTLTRSKFSSEICREENAKTRRKTKNGKKDTFFYYPDLENNPF